MPDVAPPIIIPTINFTENAQLFANLPKAIASALPAPMEAFGQGFGYILYRTQLPTAVNGGLFIKDVHDFATIYINGKFAGTLDRRNAAPNGSLPPLQIDTTGPAQLDILVANDGRVNVDHTMLTETKGITQFVVLDSRPLSDWKVCLLRMQELPTGYIRMSPLEQAADSEKMDKVMAFYAAQHSAPATAAPCGFAYSTACPTYISAALSAPPVDILSSVDAQLAAHPPVLEPHFFRAHFTVATTGDTFLDTHSLGKGAVWINGHNLGRFWNTGPQQTLYVPGPWLKTGENEIVVFDMLPTAHESVDGLDHPILDGPVSDKTISNQE